MRGGKFYAHPQPWRAGIALHFAVENGDTFSVAKPATMEQADIGSHTEPFLNIDMRAAQQLMDELWNCGLRPTEGSGSAGSLAATERHLADMRRIVFDDKPKGNHE
jgi:hypothetical protein